MEWVYGKAYSSMCTSQVSVQKHDEVDVINQKANTTRNDSKESCDLSISHRLLIVDTISLYVIIGCIVSIAKSVSPISVFVYICC